MRVLTWNVWWRFGGNWSAREQRILLTLERLSPDIAGFQEIWLGDATSQMHAFGGRLGMHAAAVSMSIPPVPRPTEYPEQDGMEMGVGLLSRWPISHVRRHPLPALHRDPPVALVASIDHPLGVLPVIVACTEWEPHRFDDHLAQTRELAMLAVDLSLDGSLPIILIGDLNASVDMPQMQPLLDVMMDAWEAGAGDPSTTTLSSANPFAPREARAQIDRRIDHVLLRRGSHGGEVYVERAFAVDEPVDGVHPSDHAAVVIDLAL